MRAANTNAHEADESLMPPTLPDWYDPADTVVQDMLLGLQLICSVQRAPHRGEHCPGLAAAVDRMLSRHERPADRWTNIDFAVDFLYPGGALPGDFKHAVGSIARACMPGYADPPNWHDASTKAYIAKLDTMDWGNAETRWAQFNAWRGPALRCAQRCGAPEKLVLEVLTVICFAPEVGEANLDFCKLAAEVAWRIRTKVRLEHSGGDEEQWR
ncbi:MAG: hypothetical protein ACYSVY_27165 [Planctomycetota bacterium]